MAERLRRILVTDDKAEIRDFVRMVLEENGYHVILAYDGEDCLRRVLEEKPDMLIIDIMMPKKSGYHALQELGAKDPRVRNIPILIMAGSMNIRELFDDWKIQGFLQKPFTSKQLLEKVEAAWQRRDHA